MSVKRSRSASRVLAVLEGIARHQPVGVTELARRLGDDKSAVQRAIMTLADDGWIGQAAGQPTRWQLTPHILAVSHDAQLSNDLYKRARPVLETLQAESGESVMLNTPDRNRFVIVDVLESRQLLRAVPSVGMEVPVRSSATSRALLPYMSPQRQLEILGGPLDPGLRAELADTLRLGYAVSAGEISPGSTSIAAPVIGSDGEPVAAVVLTGPSTRLTRQKYAWAGGLVREAARKLSRGQARPDMSLTAA